MVWGSQGVLETPRDSLVWKSRPSPLPPTPEAGCESEEVIVRMRVSSWKNILETCMSAFGKCHMNSSPNAPEPDALGRTRAPRALSQLLPSPRRLITWPMWTPSSPPL